MGDVTERPCKACGCPLVFVPGPGGKAIPLDKRAPVYHVTADLTGETTAVRADGFFVSHFATCSKANQFSKMRGKEARR